MSKLRFRVVETAFKKKPVAVAVPAERPSEYFAMICIQQGEDVPLSAEQGVCQTDGCD